MPHDGPFVQEFVNYDEWAQMLANNGYMVLQPQYRGSLGYGAGFHRVAIEGGGQGGYKMQDDKDDGALYLVEQGLADKDRMAMFGWSYGGYAALIAASRTPQIYQCVMAAAAINDTERQADYYRHLLRGHRRNQHLSMWDDSISPIDEVEKVNVPVLLIHGSADQRVPAEQARKYQRLLEKYGKDHRYIELDGAGHLSSVLSFEQRLEFYTAIIDYLRDECGQMTNFAGASE
jgi:dipeptidyl aminopeptidase/acylaminoacyl peptidase